ncbi:DeoR/GlpR family DNA-binding transcription regulator [Paenibacillus sp. S150]|uniref:DeoR/GlpR family DNA-binding transcription regulator n=1 Tax=Paenibacillus sp. S150 TaxID=2749826 RepID=UPI001C56B002|nr:DeoR/GlpR family DNA-binding transcription regulator [Paenibacillus sp. S150]MBW4084308.1 DeoR/GlpR transcriptional regulator [Paenibacillus sp. S150]
MKARQRMMISYLEQHTFLSVNKLAELLEISLPTVRRDLQEMETDGYVQRVNGGAFLINKRDNPPEQAQRSDPFEAHKKAIAAEAVKWIQPGDTLFIDSGSTNSCLADFLTELKGITIVTNSIDIAYKCMRRPGLSVFVCGGTNEEVRAEAGIVGPLAEQLIMQFRASLCILGTSGLDLKQGITDPFLSAASIKDKMLTYSSKRILVTDHSKFGKIHKAFVAPIESFDCIITDWEADIGDIAHIRSQGTNVIQAAPGQGQPPS